jgi:hypothetical protein
VLARLAQFASRASAPLLCCFYPVFGLLMCRITCLPRKRARWSRTFCMRRHSITFGASTSAGGKVISAVDVAAIPSLTLKRIAGRQLKF